MAAGRASCFNLVWVACSYAKANEISLNSLNAVPMKDKPKGMLGPNARVGSAGESGVSAGWNPRGTAVYEFRAGPGYIVRKGTSNLSREDNPQSLQE